MARTSMTQIESMDVRFDVFGVVWLKGQSDGEDDLSAIGTTADRGSRRFPDPRGLLDYSGTQQEPNRPSSSNAFWSNISRYHLWTILTYAHVCLCE